jgi:hypothetical protein
MSNGYQFFIQKYPTSKAEYKQVDLEQEFGCVYRSMTNINTKGTIKNVYSEDFAEQDGSNFYVPPTVRHNTTECTLSLLFKSEKCHENSQKLYEYIEGRYIEWYDTFRKKYVTLLFKDSMTVGDEKLYKGKGSYTCVTFKFTNIYGLSFAESKIAAGLQNPD